MTTEITHSDSEKFRIRFTVCELRDEPVKTLFLVNPKAGGGSAARRWPPLTRKFVEAGWRVNVAMGRDATEATAMIKDAVADGMDVVVVFGGDGTVRLAAKLLAGTECALGILPGGTGNGIAYSLGLPLDPGAAGRRLLKGKRQQVDVGVVRGLASGVVDRFINVGGAGFDARLSDGVAHAPPHLKGIPAYVFAAVRTIPTMSLQTVRVEADGHLLSAKALVVAAANGSCYGKGLYIAPDASVSDGLLDVCVVDEVSLIELASIVPLVFFGHHVGHPKVKYGKAKVVRVTAPAPVLAQADGDLVGQTPVEFSLEPSSLWIIR